MKKSKKGSRLALQGLMATIALFLECKIWISGGTAFFAENPKMKKFVSDHTPHADAEDDTCKKDLGKTRSYRKMTRGHMVIVRGGGHIDAFQEIYW